MKKFKNPASLLALIVPLLLSGILKGDPVPETPQKRPAGRLIVNYLDCGQGDAAVIRTPKGKIYLIDSGPNDTLYGGDFDSGKEVVVPFLQSIGAKVIDGILISHPHLDHYGGALAVMENFEVRELIDSGWPTKSPPYLKVLKKIEKAGIGYRVVKEGDKLNWGPEFKIEVLGPRTEIFAKEVKKENPNNRSVIIKLIYKKIAFLFPGDAEDEAEEHLVKMFGSQLESHILKAPHHGSKTSSTEEFLDAVRPELAIISCGRRNRFRHPHPSTIERFKKLKIPYYRTDLDGTIEVTTNGETYSVKTFGLTNIPVEE